MTGMLAQLDVKPPMDELQMENLSCDSANEAYDSGDESNLPPPLPYFDRRTHDAVRSDDHAGGAIAGEFIVADQRSRGWTGCPPSKVVYMCNSTVPIYFSCNHSAKNEFSAIHFELNFNAVKDIETKLMP
jgi:hypothetical protein